MIDTTKYTQILILKRHWALAVTTALTVIALVVPVALGMPNVYRAGTKLSVERQVSMTATQMQILNSLETRLQMIKNEALSTPYLRQTVERLDLYPNLRRQYDLETAINRVQRDIFVGTNSQLNTNSGPMTLTFTVSFLGDDPVKVKQVADALAQFYIDQNDAMRSRQASKAVQDLDTQVKELKHEYDDAIFRLNGYLASHPSKVPQMQAIKSASLGRVTTGLLGKTTRLSTLKSLQSNYSLQIAAALNAPPTAAVAQTRDQQLVMARAELRRLLDSNAGESNSMVIAARSRIATLEALPPDPVTPVEGTATTQIDIYKKAFAEAESEMNTLTKEIAGQEEEQQRLMAELATIPMLNPDLDDLTRNVTMVREQFDGIQKKYSEAFSAAQIERTQAGEEFRVLEPATVPTEPAGPHRLSLILAGIIGALVAGLGIAIVRDQFDTSFHTLDELRDFTQVPVLVSIPDIVTNKHRVRRTAVVVVGACVLLISLAVVSVGAYSYAQRHAGLTRLVTK